MTLKRHNLLKFYGTAGMLITINVSLLILVSGYIRARLRAASVCQTRIGQHSVIPVHYKDLQRFYPMAVNLSLAEIEASLSSSHETAYQISRQMLEDMTTYTRAISGKPGKFSKSGEAFDSPSSPLSASFGVPTLAALLHEGTRPGKTAASGLFTGSTSVSSLARSEIYGYCRMAGQRQNAFHCLFHRCECLAYGAGICHRST